MIVSEFISNRYESICSLKLHEALREMNTTRANNKGILPFSKCPRFPSGLRETLVALDRCI